MDFDDDDDVEGITDIVKKLGWHKFTQTPPSAVAPIVEEFYANLPDSYNGKTRVRGKEVKFDAETINQYYELPQVEEDEYEEYLKNVDYDKVIRRLTKGQVKWVMVGDRYKKFFAGNLRNATRVWQYFMNTRLMPTTHNSIVDRVRGLLLYCIVTKKQMNVGNIIVSQMLSCANNLNTSYFFPVTRHNTMSTSKSSSYFKRKGDSPWHLFDL
ncbi:hypothetical protein Patl1_27998 [Pistacia atlantica]|uniref:Uncharacterized protein n=1 Tax=Pistacia atlantica TaxID=434234 RepID=A0ACC1BCI2_9ROSI|nr:hypothetical protein Patl1_27998 [Pistacia atlantica]